VSSINWNSVSPNFNREAGVIIDHPGVAGYFLEVFEDDWSTSSKTPPITTDFVKLGMVVMVLVILLIIYYRRRGV
jgi:phosphatidylserine/phosphatidylglycerophosphate/cardiolipin synthase-like enzyme